ncbi:hypothetical protein PEC18_31125 [Paucibacter sp. O1-1]|nr:hypothetical protein [Paucibacter sp. O1-1]MDA3830158.1 hypothetical protein [Paucibacter sp. O1-1]
MASREWQRSPQAALVTLCVNLSASMARLAAHGRIAGSALSSTVEVASSRQLVELKSCERFRVEPLLLSDLSPGDSSALVGV